MPAVGRQPLAVSLYRLALRALPYRFRLEYAEQMQLVFADLHRDATRDGGWRRGLRQLLAELPGLARLIEREHREARHARAAARARNPRENSDMFDSLLLDLRFALRSLRKSPGFAVVAVLTLGLGFGANTAIFSVINGVLLKPLAFAESERLVALGEGTQADPPNTLDGTTPGSFFDWKAQATAFSGIAAFTTGRTSLTRACPQGGCEPESVVFSSSTGGLLNVLGVQPFFGRMPIATDEVPGQPEVVVLSHGLWRRLFGEDRAVLGRTLTLGGRARTVIGVMPPGFRFPDGTVELWTAMQMTPEFRTNRDQYYLQVVARLKPEVTMERARADMETVAARLRSEWAQYNTDLRINAVALRESVVGDVGPRLYILQGAVALVLLITCANLGNLLLARAAARRREIAVRQALGAGRGRVVRQLLTESIVLAVAGGVVGIVLGKGFLRLLLASQSAANLPRVEDIGLDPTVLAFTFAIAVVAGIAFGIAPALQLAGSRSSEALRQGSRGNTGGGGVRSVLVVSELALAVVLLAGAGLLLRSFALLQQVDSGVRTDRLVTFSVRLPTPNPTFVSTSLERIGALPGVRSVAVVSQLPVTGRGIGAWFNIIDRPTPANETPPGEAYRVVTPEFFATTGVPLRRGRLFTSADRLEAPAVIINEALARKYWPNDDPLGKLVYLGAPDNRLFQQGTIAGVVGDTRDGGLGAEPLPIVYIPLAVMPAWPEFSYVIRMAGDPGSDLGLGSIVASARREIRALDPTLPIRNVQTMNEVLRDSVAPQRFSMTLLSVFAGLALVMAALGVFGVLSFLVSQRTRELGIRIALGAAPGRVRAMVVGQGMRLALIGVGVGVVGALAATRLMSSQLFGVTNSDPVTYVAVSVLLIGIAGVATYLPARRATRVDPMVALRAE